MCIEREQPSTAFKPMPQITTSNNIASKAVIHPDFQTEGDGFMKLGDIKGEFASAPEAIGADALAPAVRGPLSDMTSNANDFGSFELRANEFGSFEPQVGDIPVQQVNGSIAAFEPTDSLVNFAGADARVDTEQDAFSGMNQGFATSLVNELRSDNRFVIEPMETITSFGAAMNASPEIGALTGLNASMIDPGGSPTFAQAPITDGLVL